MDAPTALNRCLALLLVAIAFVKAWPSSKLIWAVAFVDGVALVLIFFPASIDDFTFGTFQRGYRIDSHTPSWMIAGMGWMLLLLFTGLLFLQK